MAEAVKRHGSLAGCELVCGGGIKAVTRIGDQLTPAWPARLPASRGGL